MTRSQKQKPGEDAFFYYQVNETSPINYMYKAKIDGDHRLEFLLILFFHQGKKRRTVPRDNHIAKPMQSSVTTIKDQPIFIQTGLREYSQKQKPGEDSHPRAKRHEKPGEDSYPRAKRYERLDEDSHSRAKRYGRLGGDSYPRAKRYEKPTEDSHPRAKRYEKPGKDSYPRVSMKQIPAKF